MKTALRFIMLGILVLGDAYPQADSTIAESSSGTSGSKKTPGDGLNLLKLDDPAGYGLEFKGRFDLIKPSEGKGGGKSLGESSMVLNIDSLLGYRYHPRLHANGDVAFAFSGTSFVRKRPTDFHAPGMPSGHDSIPYFLEIDLKGGVESAPVKPLTGDSLDWRSSNSNGTVKIFGKVPYSDIPGEALAKALDLHSTFIGGLVVGVDAAYLNTKKESPSTDDGFRGKITGGYQLPFVLDCELYAAYEYSWGPALIGDQKFYYIQISRYFSGDKFVSLFSMVSGKKTTPRLFFRYYDGGTAPAYVKSHGFEFGIGTDVF